MSREERHGEEFLQGGVAYPNRIEYGFSDGSGEWLFVGIRANGAISFRAGPDRIVQFNAEGCLRRLDWDGSTFRADGARLSLLNRQSEGLRIRWVVQPLAEDEHAARIRAVERLLDETAERLLESRFSIRGQVNSTIVDLTQHILEWLRALPRPLRIARSPHVG